MQAQYSTYNTSKSSQNVSSLSIVFLSLLPVLSATVSVKASAILALCAVVSLVLSSGIVCLIGKTISNYISFISFVILNVSFISAVQMLCRAYLPKSADFSSVYLPFLIISTVIIGYKEASNMKFSSNQFFKSNLKIGFLFAITIIVLSSFREIIGFGSFADMTIPFFSAYTIAYFTTSSGGFILCGILLTLSKLLTKGRLS